MLLLKKLWLGGMERTIHGLHAIAQRRKRHQKLPQHLVTGMEGERKAYFYLRRRGYSVVARRWSADGIPGDLDLIAWHSDTLCFFEVKTRTRRDATPAEVAVDQHKRRILRQLARRYVQRLPQIANSSNPTVRFDVLSVYLQPKSKTEFEHFQNAFEWTEK